ncbi:MAG: T9SS type A sorting domain-containing protein [Sporocytophaga sp.]|uniref:T9SS type A sorting domain-containing protein n=1 Tax=Sporocytophaga sp. TaxID=2231183 RepID=UPI001AFE8ACC|nr:T9SS type A sorting domain-containing protein [Sporocytophaga sp.]MBO9700038.1 T9SS type A sorting domain-containing protein [Sporocytophaga sp.]
MKRLVQKIVFILAVVILWQGGTLAQTTHQVIISNSKIEPAMLGIDPNDTVEFIWVGNSSSMHPIKSDDGSNLISSPDGVKSYKIYDNHRELFAGRTFTYACTIHSGMKGSIAVGLGLGGLTDLKESKYEFQVTPNPFEDELNLTIFPGNKNVKFIKIFDIIGKEVASIDLSSKVGPSAYKVDFSNLRPGLYFCNVYSDKGIIETRKILRNRS